VRAFVCVCVGVCVCVLVWVCVRGGGGGRARMRARKCMHVHTQFQIICKIRNNRTAHSTLQHAHNQAAQARQQLKQQPLI